MNCDLSIERLFQKYHVYDIRSLIPNYGNELEEEAEIVRARKACKKIRPTFGTAMFTKNSRNLDMNSRNELNMNSRNELNMNSRNELKSRYQDIKIKI